MTGAASGCGRGCAVTGQGGQHDREGRSILRDLTAAWRSLGRAKGLTAAVVLLGAAVTASAIPAMRAARVDVVQALRSE